uniref:Methyltransferase like 4 n=1 Tax=Xenopus tropicalis TaxID=8364 RepID=A0A803K927_XENTR
MTVVCESSAGWLVDELSLFRKWYQHSTSCQDADHKKNQYGIRGDLFLILRPHIPKQSTPVSLPTVCPETNPTATNQKKKRKRSCAFNQGELDAMDYHKKITDFILEGTQPLIQEGFKKLFLQALSVNDNHSQTEPGLCNNPCQLAELCNMAKSMPLLNFGEHTVLVLESGLYLPQETNVLSCITENKSECPKVIHFIGEKYIIPPKSAFLMSDVSCMEPLLQYKKYNIIVMDPPWENKSVKRSKRYNSLSPNEIQQLPVPALAAPDCLVITWVTNKQKHLRFVKEDLYPQWSVRTLGEWHWVKITRSGEFVFPLDSNHKKPYEVLVLGRFQGTVNSAGRESGISLPPIPERKLIVSVPCKLHSHKPPLSDYQTTETMYQNSASLQPGLHFPQFLGCFCYCFGLGSWHNSMTVITFTFFSLYPLFTHAFCILL